MGTQCLSTDLEMRVSTQYQTTNLSSSVNNLLPICISAAGIYLGKMNHTFIVQLLVSIVSTNKIHTTTFVQILHKDSSNRE